MNQIFSVNQGLKTRLEAKGKSAQAAVAKLQSDLGTQILITGGLSLSAYLLLAFSTSARRSLSALEETSRRVAVAFNQTLQNLRSPPAPSRRLTRCSPPLSC